MVAAAEGLLDHATMWRQMRRLLDGLSAVTDRDDVLDESLSIVLDVLGADRGMVLLTPEDGSAHVVLARGAHGALTAHEREEISRTIVHEASDSGRCVQWSIDDVQVGAPSSIMSFGIRAALAARFHSSTAREPRGVLYVDFRRHGGFIGDRHLEFFMAAVVLFGAVLEQRARAQSTREQLQEAKSRCVEARRTPPLDELLAPPSMAQIRHELESALHGDAPILIEGESGTGKTLFAQAIAEASNRRPIVRAVLGGSDDLNTITSELFGHEKGSFSGAAGKRVGLVEFADQGTLVLDEILNLPLHAQKVLLDFTQFGTYRPLGYERPQPKEARVRIIAATNGDLRAAIRDGRFREDLYYRLAAVTLHLAPLRERAGDTPALAEATLGRDDPSRKWTLAPDLRQWLVAGALAWPGNVRQFERAVQRARQRAITREPACRALRLEHFELDATPTAARAAPGTKDTTLAGRWAQIQDEAAALEARERDLLKEGLAAHGGVVAYVAKELGVPRTTLASRVQSLKIAPK